MPEYREMYGTLFRAVTQAVTVLQVAQQKAEEMCIGADPPDIVLLTRDSADTGEENEEDGDQS